MAEVLSSLPILILTKMRTKNLISTLYISVPPSTETESLKNYLSERKAFVVEDEQNVYGYFTRTDLFRKTGRTALDYIDNQPSVERNSNLHDVYKLMQDCDTDVIGVMNNGIFMGLIYKDDLIVYLLKNNQDKDKQIHTIAHDLKNPISAIEGMVELIKMEENESSRTKYLNYILQACSDSYNIISNLLELASIEHEISKHLENVDINVLLNEFLSEPLYSAKRKNITIHNNIDDNHWYVNINPKHFKRAIQNLIVNSIKFSNPGDEITLSTYLDNDRVIIKTSDEGIGIPSHLQSEIFKKFSKARRKGTQGEQSTGLGMAIVKEIVEFHNGKIWLWSEEGKGTEVYISLPLIPVIDHSTTLSNI